MWNTKSFKTNEERELWIEKHSHKFQITKTFIHNGYGVEYKALRMI